MNTRELFETVAAHLLLQGRQSKGAYVDNGAPVCAYRGSNGMKCAIGCLIDDTYYVPTLEMRNIHDESVRIAVESSIGRPLQTSDLDLLDSLQRLHDSRNPDEWPTALEHMRKALQ